MSEARKRHLRYGQTFYEQQNDLLNNLQVLAVADKAAQWHHAVDRGW